ncbi:MAG: HEAT repeat domain-containing protein [Candidatus Thermoplasmatota archaeon]|nr:HEAT repeat domain-containing protein [Candidatus Thermoplasmatota archaeon]
MVREYIARDPRTGLPIATGRRQTQKTNKKERIGPWLECTRQELHDLSTGQTENLTVNWNGGRHTLSRVDGVQGLGRLKGVWAERSHASLLLALESDDADVRVAALEVLPTVAEQRSDELFDWLSVLLDDDDVRVRQAASTCLEQAAPTFPSGVDSSLAQELRSTIAARSEPAWRGLKALTETWPEVVCDHIDELLLVDDIRLRRKASKLLRNIVQRAGAMGWDLISWALNDADAEVRRNASQTLSSLSKKEPRIAIMLTERAILDSDEKVRNNALRAIRSMDTDDSRARNLIMNGARHPNAVVRRSCIEMLPMLLVEDKLRIVATELLQSETNAELKKMLTEMTFDASIEGTEAEKNAFLSPALPVPALEREVAHAQGKAVGLGNAPPEPHLLDAPRDDDVQDA